MGLAVVTVAAGGLPVVESTAGGTPVTEAANGRGVSVTKVAALGLPVVFETIGLAAPVTYPTWDAATVASVTLSGGNLVATNTDGTSNANQGARGANAVGKTSGKLYFEETFTNVTGGGNCGVGVGTTASTYTGMGGNGTAGGIVFRASGNIYGNGLNSGVSLGARSFTDVIGIAVDLDNRKIWFRVSPAGNWNNNVANNPATNVGGITIPAGTMVPFCTFGGAIPFSGNVVTANFGASAFSGAVPAGFTSGWPA